MQRISLVPGDFFEDPLPEADVFVLSRIIHDWDANKANGLLQKIYNKLPEGGAVLICEMLLDEDGCGPIDTLLQSLSIYLILLALLPLTVYHLLPGRYVSADWWYRAKIL